MGVGREGVGAGGGGSWVTETKLQLDLRSKSEHSLMPQRAAGDCDLHLTTE